MKQAVMLAVSARSNSLVRHLPDYRLQPLQTATLPLIPQTLLPTSKREPACYRESHTLPTAFQAPLETH